MLLRNLPTRRSDCLTSDIAKTLNSVEQLRLWMTLKEYFQLTLLLRELQVE
jgi:hypothetical protein